MDFAKGIAEKITQVVMNYSDVEIKVREATNDEPWGPSGSQMQELAYHTHRYEGYADVVCMLWKRMLQDNKNNWRRVYKSLQVLSYLLKFGSDKVIISAQEHLYDLKFLEEYTCIDEHGKDQGLNVRQKVKDVIDLVVDVERLESERKKAQKSKSKIVGISKELAGNYVDYNKQNFEKEKRHSNRSDDWHHNEYRDNDGDGDYNKRDMWGSDNGNDDHPRSSSTRDRFKKSHSDGKEKVFQKESNENVDDDDDDDFNPRALESKTAEDSSGFGEFTQYESHQTATASSGSNTTNNMLIFDPIDNLNKTPAPRLGGSYSAGIPLSLIDDSSNKLNLYLNTSSTTMMNQVPSPTTPFANVGNASQLSPTSATPPYSPYTTNHMMGYSNIQMSPMVNQNQFYRSWPSYPGQQAVPSNAIGGSWYQQPMAVQQAGLSLSAMPNLVRPNFPVTNRQNSLL